jgi:hypothetical protein
MTSAQPQHRWERAIDLDYAQYHVIVDSNPLQEVPGEPPTGLVDVLAEQLTVFTGLREGRLRLQLEIWAEEPALDVEGWDDIVDTKLISAIGEITVADMFGQSDETYPNLAGHGPGSYLLRVSVRGRDQGSAGDVAAEVHRLQCWPVPAARPPVTRARKLTDHVGQVWRGDEPPPVLAPWEVRGARAMHEFLAVTAAVAEEETTTLVVHREYALSQAKLFSSFSTLVGLVGNGGSGLPGVGQETECNVYDAPVGDLRVTLNSLWVSSAPPSGVLYQVQWRRYELRPWRLTLLGTAQTWEMTLETSANGVTVTVTCHAVPVSWQSSLSGLWTYWFDQQQAVYDAAPSQRAPWNLLAL